MGVQLSIFEFLQIFDRFELEEEYRQYREISHADGDYQLIPCSETERFLDSEHAKKKHYCAREWRFETLFSCRS